VVYSPNLLFSWYIQKSAHCLHLRSIQRRANGLLLRVNVALRDVHVAVTGEVRQRPRVHVRCPPGLHTEKGCRLLNRLSVLPLEGGWLHVSADGGSRKDPIGTTGFGEAAYPKSLAHAESWEFCDGRYRFSPY